MKFIPWNDILLNTGTAKEAPAGVLPVDYSQLYGLRPSLFVQEAIKPAPEMDRFVGDIDVIDLVGMRPFHDSSRYSLFVAGGCIRKHVEKMVDWDTGETDYDVFVANMPLPDDIRVRKAVIDDVLELVHKDIPHWKLVYRCKEELLATFKTRQGAKVQIILANAGQNQFQNISRFDFLQCQAGFWFTSNQRVLMFSNMERYFETIAKRELVINRVVSPVATFKRINRYQKKGYKVNDAIMDYVDNIAMTGWEASQQGLSSDQMRELLDMRVYID